MFDVSKVGSDEWWMHRLISELGRGFERMGRLRSYRDGDAILPLESLSAAERNVFQRFARLNRLHVVELIRDARTTKQRIIGFRTAAEGDEEGDAEAWRLWKHSRMQARAQALFNDIADYGAAYLIVEAQDGELPWLRTATGWNVATHADVRRPWVTDVAVEVDYDLELQSDIVRFWRRDPVTGGVYGRVARSLAPVGSSTVPTDGKAWSPTADWEWLPFGTDGRVWLPHSQVPVVKVQTETGFGVWEKHIDTIDRINYQTFQLMQLVVTQSFRQAAISADLPSHWPEDDPEGRGGEPINYDLIFQTGPNALWRLPSDGKLQTFPPVDPRPMIELRNDDIKKLAAFTSTPYYMLSSDSANNSAEGASLASDGLFSQVQSMNNRAEVGVCQALAAAFEAVGDTVRADTAELEARWAPLKRSSLSEMGAAAQQAKAGGATQRFIDEHIFNMTPAERDQARVDRETEAWLNDGE